ncbi:MipA/OmpV family protein [Caldimonas sp. KR1-144]|uniref:MipA/OmpV family protein n=1 Tax=Caldimonas sp. KR1-144 TaxID=3400911 RepID=UPI003BFFBD37
MSRSLAHYAVVSLAAAAASLFQATACAQSAEDDRLHISVGAAALSSPEYPGSGDQETRAVPMLRIDYGRFFLGNVPGLPEAAGIGARLYRNGGLTLGAAVTAELRDIRKESDAARLAGLGDVEGTQRVALYGVYTFDRYALRAAVAQDIGDKDLGLVGALEADVSFALTPSLSLTIGPTLTFGSSEYMQTVYGVTPLQSARSGMPVHSAGSGLTSVRFSATANYRFTPQWSAGLRLTAGRLQGDAKDSPIVEDETQNSVAAFVVYSF